MADSSCEQLPLTEPWAVCTQCDRAKPVADFPRRKDRASRKGHYSYCRECGNKMAANYRRRLGRTPQEQRTASKQPGYYRERDLKRKFGLTIAEYDALLENQGGKCAICATDDPGRGSRHFYIDHDHESGQIRGLLCNTCNRGLGLFGDSPDRLGSAMSYLMQTKEARTYR